MLAVQGRYQPVDHTDAVHGETMPRAPQDATRTSLVVLRNGNSGTAAPSASLENFRLASTPSQSIEITSPKDTCWVASKLASGYTTCRSIARFKCRAPYFMSVP